MAGMLGHSLRQLLLQLTCIVLVVVANRSPRTVPNITYEDQNKAVLSPIKPNLTVGKIFKFTCTLNKKYRRKKNKDSSDMFFTIENNNGESVFKKDWVHIVNETQVLLIIPDVNMTYDNAMLNCYVKAGPNHWHYVAGEKLHAGTIPTKPVITSIKNINNEQLEFSFNASDSSGDYKNTYQAWYATSNESYKRCPNQLPNNTCIILNFTLPHHGMYAIKVNASNKFGSIESSIKRANIHNYFKPNPVKNFKRTMITNFDVNFTWETPFNYKEFNYEITKTSQWYEKPKVIKQKDVFMFNWPNLRPYTNYSVCIRCHPVSPKGFWSDSSCIYFRTAQSLPLRSPLVADGSFERKVSPVNVYYREIVIHWQPLTEQELQGKFICYRLEYIVGTNIQNKTVTVKDSTWIRLENMNPDTKYNFMLSVINEKGVSSPATVINVPAEHNAPEYIRNVTVISQGQNIVHVTWSTKHGSKKGDLVSVFWCLRAGMRECAGEVEFYKLNYTRGFYEIILKEKGDRSYLKYLFGVSRQHGLNHSGIDWSECVYSSRAAGTRPQVESLLNSTNSVKLKISPPSCSDGTGYIYAYDFLYCLLEKSNSTTCKGESVYSTRMRHENGGSYTFDNLEKLSFYQFKVKSLTRAGPSHSEKTIIIKTTGMNTSTIVGLAIASFVGFILVMAGIYACYRWNVKLIRWCRTCFHLEIKTFEPDVFLDDIPHDTAQNIDEDEGPDIILPETNDNELTNGGPIAWRPSSQKQKQPPLPPIPTNEPPTKPLPGISLEKEKEINSKVMKNPNFPLSMNDLIRRHQHNVVPQMRPVVSPAPAPAPSLPQQPVVGRVIPQLLPPATQGPRVPVDELSMPVPESGEESLSVPTEIPDVSQGYRYTGDGYQAGRIQLASPQGITELPEENPSEDDAEDPLLDPGLETLTPPHLTSANEEHGPLLPARSLLPSPNLHTAPHTYHDTSGNSSRAQSSQHQVPQTVNANIDAYCEVAPGNK